MTKTAEKYIEYSQKTKMNYFTQITVHAGENMYMWITFISELLETCPLQTPYRPVFNFSTRTTLIKVWVHIFSSQGLSTSRVNEHPATGGSPSVTTYQEH